MTPLGMGNLTRREIEEVWRNRVRDAQLRLDFARNFVKEVQRDFPPDSVPSADGRFAFQKALRVENFALAEYRRVLRIFTDLALGGKTPDENAWWHRKAASAGGGEGN